MGNGTSIFKVKLSPKEELGKRQPLKKMRNLVKCLVWDLDNTIWQGTLLEGDCCRLKPGIRSIIEQLDQRGILHSIASKNDRDMALKIIHSKGIANYFLFPQITWTSKVKSLQTIVKNLNIGLNALGFIDDDTLCPELLTCS